MYAVEQDWAVWETFHLEDEIPCSWYEWRSPDHPTDQTAKWRVLTKRCACGHKGILHLCEACKEVCMTSESGIVCSRCNLVTTPCRVMVVSIEPLT